MNEMTVMPEVYEVRERGLCGVRCALRAYSGSFITAIAGLAGKTVRVVSAGPDSLVLEEVPEPKE